MLPASQPITAPTAIAAAVVAARSMPAPAGSNVGREGRSIEPSIPKLVTLPSGHFSTKTGDFRPTLFTGYRARVADFHVETIGSGPKVVLVHGSVGNGRATWEGVRTLADRFELAIVD